MRLLRPLRLLLPFVAIGVALVVFLVLGFLAFSPNTGGQQQYTMNGCDAGAATVGPGGRAGATIDTLADDQRQNAQTIISVGKQLNAPPRAWVVALATAMQESTLRNINYGDRDSLGLFQQRPSQGWGTPAQVTDPQYSAKTFYERLLALPGWEQQPVTVAAQDVQRSAFPDAYAKWENLAVQLVGQVGNVANPTGCGAPSANLPPGVAKTAIDFALAQVGKPYVWGGNGPNVYDCSGLVQQAFKAAGVTVPRVADAQYQAGGHLPVRQAQPGDLMFYAYDRSDPATIHHVFIYLGNDQMVEAPYSGENVRVQPVSWNYSELVPLATRPGTPANTA